MTAATKILAPSYEDIGGYDFKGISIEVVHDVYRPGVCADFNRRFKTRIELLEDSLEMTCMYNIKDTIIERRYTFDKQLIMRNLTDSTID